MFLAKLDVPALVATHISSLETRPRRRRQRRSLPTHRFETALIISAVSGPRLVRVLGIGYHPAMTKGAESPQRPSIKPARSLLGGSSSCSGSGLLGTMLVMVLLHRRGSISRGNRSSRRARGRRRSLRSGRRLREGGNCNRTQKGGDQQVLGGGHDNFRKRVSRLAPSLLSGPRDRRACHHNAG